MIVKVGVFFNLGRREIEIIYEWDSPLKMFINYSCLSFISFILQRNTLTYPWLLLPRYLLTTA